MTVTEVRRIREYCGPGWLIDLQDGGSVDPQEHEELVEVINELGFEVLDRTIMGWGDYNAVISVTDRFGTTCHYLATLIGE